MTTSEYRAADALARAICAELGVKFGPLQFQRAAYADDPARPIELAAECHGDSWIFLGAYGVAEAQRVLARLRALPRREDEAACSKSSA